MIYEFYTANTAMFLYWLIYGIISGLILSIAIYMFISPRPVSLVDYPVSMPLRKAAGAIFIVVALEVVVSVGIMFFLDQFTAHSALWYMTDWGASCLQQLLAVLFVPAVCYFLQAVLQGENRFSMYAIILTMLFPLFLLAWTIVFGMTHTELESAAFCRHVLYIVRAYWAIFTINLLYFYTKAVRRYQLHLHDAYSDISNRHVTWLYVLGVLNVIYIGWFIVVCVTDIPFHVAAMVGQVLALGITIYTCYHVDRQQLITWEVPSEETCVDEDLPVLKELDAKMEEWLENKGYLSADLTRDDLARALSTNRTYLNMYMTSKGVSFYKFINVHRIEYAISLLQDEEKQPLLSEVATACGYKSLEVFSRQFKLVTGTTPSSYRGGRKNPLNDA